MATCTIYHNSKIMVQHVPSNEYHSERPERIVACEGLLKGYSYMDSLSYLTLKREKGFAALKIIPALPNSVWKRCQTKEVTEMLSRKDLTDEYGEDRVRMWEAICADKGEPATDEGDNYWAAGSMLAARIAAQSAVQAAEDILTGVTRNAFCLLRPPGHHCFQNPAGFCILNNVVLAAKEFLKVGKRVAIVDWDYHFGDGTAKRFISNENVMFVSLHCKKTRSGFTTYPANDVGDLKGVGLAKLTGGRMWNIQWESDDADDAAVQYAFQTSICPKFKAWNPDVILISAGYDAVKGDDLAGMEVSPQQFRRCTRALLELGFPVLAILEGGYNPELLAKSVRETVLGLLGDDVEPIVGNVKMHHKRLVDSL